MAELQAQRKPPTYSEAPCERIDITALPSTRFILPDERRYPYRDVLGRININLIERSLAEIDDGDADDVPRARLETWKRHCRRAICQRPEDETTTLEDLFSGKEDDEEVARMVHPKTVAMRQRRLFRAPRPDDEPLFGDLDDEPLGIDRLHMCHLANERAAKKRAHAPRGRASRESGGGGGGDGEKVSSGSSGSQGGSSDDDSVYEVEAILDEDESDDGARGADASGPHFLIRWSGYGPDHDSWEPEENVAPQLVADYRKAKHLQASHVGDDYMSGRTRMLWCATCGSHYASDSFSANQRRIGAAHRVCLNHHYKSGATHASPTKLLLGSSGYESVHATPARRREASATVHTSSLKRKAETIDLPSLPIELPSPRAPPPPPPPPRKAGQTVARSLSHRQAALAGGRHLFP